VVIEFYGDHLVTVPLDRATWEIEKIFYILKMSEMGEIPLMYAEVDKLTGKQRRECQLKLVTLIILWGLLRLVSIKKILIYNI
jgi:hypothetical protein